MSDWGERITELRKALGYTQVQLATACKVTPPSVNGWESGATKMIDGPNLLRAAAFLECSPEYIMFGTKGGKVAIGVPDAPSQPLRPDTSTLARALELVERGIATAPKTVVVPMRRKASITTVVYQRISAGLSAKEAMLLVHDMLASS